MILPHVTQTVVSMQCWTSSVSILICMIIAVLAGSCTVWLPYLHFGSIGIVTPLSSCVQTCVLLGGWAHASPMTRPSGSVLCRAFYPARQGRSCAFVSSTPSGWLTGERWGFRSMQASCRDTLVFPPMPQSVLATLHSGP